MTNRELSKALSNTGSEGGACLYSLYLSRANQMLLLLMHWGKKEGECSKLFRSLNRAMDVDALVAGSIHLIASADLLEVALTDLGKRPDEEAEDLAENLYGQ